MDTQVLFELLFCLTNLLNMGTKFLGYVGATAEPLCVEFCNFCEVSYLCKLFNLLNNVRKVEDSFQNFLFTFLWR
jgi:hypothetical protein